MATTILARQPRISWEIHPKQRTRKDWVPFIAAKSVVGLEMELDYKDDFTNEDLRDISPNEFGLSSSSFECPVCNGYDCWTHEPANLIRRIVNDCTLGLDDAARGEEFLVYGSPIRSEEFARRLPLAAMKKHFYVASEDSLHSHVLIPDDLTANPMPLVIARNIWQLYRVYFPAWAYLFGNFRERIFRSSWAMWTTYSVSALEKDWFAFKEHAGSRKLDGGIHFGKCKRQKVIRGNDSFEPTKLKGNITHFDVEIRSTDGSLEQDQIIACRALSKALVLRGAQLANKGAIEIPAVKVAAVDEMNHYINSGAAGHRDCESLDLIVMKERAIDFYNDMKPFLTGFERANVKSIFLNPVRNRKGAVGY